MPFFEDVKCRFRAVLGGKIPIARLDAGADLAAIARAAAPAGILGIENQGRPATARRLQSGAQAGETRSDNRHIDSSRQLRRRQGRAWRPLPPIRLFREIFGKDGFVHAPASIRQSTLSERRKMTIAKTTSA